MAKSIKVKVTGQEYARFLNILEALDYHWLSGQRAADPPRFLGHLDNNVVGVRILNPDTKCIGFYPIEILSDNERSVTLLKCMSVDSMIKKLENIHNVHLDENLINRITTHTYKDKTLQDFASVMQSIIYEEFGIDIVDLINTEDEQLIYIKQHAMDESAGNNVICKDMPQLYQQYLGNSMSLEQFAHEVGTRYSYAVRDAKLQAKEIEEKEDIPEEEDDLLR